MKNFKKLAAYLVVPVAVVGVLFSVAWMDAIPLGKCPAVDPVDGPVFLPNPDDCTTFFVCSNGVPILQRCPDGLYFDPRWNICDWPQNVECDDGIDRGYGDNNHTIDDDDDDGRLVSPTYRPDKAGNDSRCKISVMLDVNGKFIKQGESLEGEIGLHYERVDGLRNRCPKKGNGCTVYSCQPVALQ